MNNNDFLKSIDARNFKHEEIIDGVRVVHTGKTCYFIGKNQKSFPREFLEMYDSNGNRFCQNCSSREEAEEIIAKLKKEGKEAIIGPAAPTMSHSTGNLIRNRMKGCVGIYIVKQKDEKVVETDKETVK